MAHETKDISHINEKDEVNNTKLFAWLIGMFVFFIIFSIGIGILFYTDVLHNQSNNPNAKPVKQVVDALKLVK